MQKNYDVIVIGVGSMGSASMYHLAKAGLNVLGLEQFNIVHQNGSYHGETRIIRFSYDEGRQYVDLALHARTLWQDLEQESRSHIFYPIGGLYIAEDGYSRFFDTPIQIAKDYGFDHEILDHQHINERFPAFNLKSGYKGFYEKDSGYLVPENAITAHVQMAQKHGADILDNTLVIDIKVQGDTIEVKTDKDIFSCAKLIVSAGAWMSTLLPTLKEKITLSRNVICWFQPKHPEKCNNRNMPIYTISDHLSQRKGAAYGFPIHCIPGIKFALHDENAATTLETLDRTVTQKEIDDLYTHAKHYFDLEDVGAVHSSVCLYSMTPDKHFILGAHPEHENIFLAGGFSGHGFKFSSVVGEIMKDLITTKQCQFDLSSFAPRRFMNGNV